MYETSACEYNAAFSQAGEGFAPKREMEFQN